MTRANHASARQLGPLTQFPPQRSLSFCPASPSSITLQPLPLDLLILVPRPTARAAETERANERANKTDESDDEKDGAPSNDPSQLVQIPFFAYSTNNNTDQ